MSEDYINYNYKMPAVKPKQTAMMELIKRLENLSIKYQNAGLLTAIEIGNSLLEMEKQQIEDAHIEGQRVFDKYPHTEWTNNQAEIYYEQTYGK